MTTPAREPNHLLLAIADDFLEAFPPEKGCPDPDDVYDWLVKQAAEVGEE